MSQLSPTMRDALRYVEPGFLIAVQMGEGASQG